MFAFLVLLGFSLMRRTSTGLMVRASSRSRRPPWSRPVVVMASVSSSPPSLQRQSERGAALHRVPEVVAGCTHRYLESTGSLLPSMHVTAPAAGGGADVWPYPIIYDNMLHDTPRPSILHKGSARGGEDGDTAAAAVAEEEGEVSWRTRRRLARSESNSSKTSGSNSEGVVRGAPHRWTGGGAGLRSQEAALAQDPLALARLALRVVYADADIIVVDKPAGLLCVPGIHSRFSLASAACLAFGLEVCN